jgi:hypothetical protein
MGTRFACRPSRVSMSQINLSCIEVIVMYVGLSWAFTVIESNSHIVHS